MSKKPKKIGLISSRRFVLINLLLRRQKNFILFIGIGFFIAGVAYPHHNIAMWVGFILAAYSAVANDSIQTIGTFIASNGNQKWWKLWLYIGLIFIITVSVSWFSYNGDVTFQRLASKGFTESPQSFNFLQVAAPLFLLILTRLRMPVSTTFLILSSFSGSVAAITGVMQKSIVGYFIAFISAFIIWIAFERLMQDKFKGKAGNQWIIFQWITSGFLWSLWIMQDAANIAVYLPRSLNVTEFLVFILTIFIGLGLIFFLKGDKIQEVVEEKSDVKDVRPATIIDLVYTLILIIFTWVNTVPMSTTWVFIGLLGGRELAKKIKKKGKLKTTWKLIGKDISYALFGLIVSVIIALAANPKVSGEVYEYLKNYF